jgi:hypothetical protein
VRRFSISLLLFALLATATGVLWRHRFEHAGPPLSEPFRPGLPGWKWLEGKGRENNPDATGALILSKQNGDPPITVERVLGQLDGVRFLHVQADVKWTEVKQSGEVRWATARGLICGKRPDGTNTWPKDHWLINAYGSSDWHREESVFDLVPDIGEARFALQHLGEQGTLEVRSVEIQVVRQRSWYVPSAALLTGLWVLWAAWTLAPALPLTFRLRPIRSLLGGTAVIAASWFLVFPQPRFCARPLVGGFALGQPIPAPVPQPPPAPTPMPPPQAPTQPITPPPVAALPTPPAPSSPTPQVPPVVEKREARVMDQEIRKLDERFNFLHLLAFGAFGLALFSTTHVRTWPMAVIVALASEALPNWQLEQAWDLGDLGDLAADFSGLALAALAVTLVRRLWQARVSRSNDPGPSVSPAPP